MHNICRHLKILLAAAIGLLISFPAASQQRFVDFGPADKFMQLSVHALIGGRAISQNYKDVYPQIQNLSVKMGLSAGIGAKAVFGMRDYLGVGTALNVVMGNYSEDLAVIGEDHSSMSALFVDNRNFSINVPVFAALRFNVAPSVRWIVELGTYYSFGFAGRQRQHIYMAQINSMDELVPEFENVKTDYYHSPRTILNMFNRGDIGLHIGTSLDFGNHFNIGVQTQVGLKNSARQTPIDKSSIHNLDVTAVAGYRF